MLCSAATCAGAGRGTVILVSAPSGTGKTAYLEQWSRVLQSQASAVTWERGAPGRDFWARMADEWLVPDDPDAPGPSPRRVVIIDDAHQISGSDEVSAVVEVLDGLPAHTAIVFCARYDPPVPWHRYARDRRFTRIGETDLALRADEIADALGESAIALNHVQAERIHALTSGWLLLVSAVADRLAGRRDVDDCIDGIASSPRPPTDDLIGSLIAELPEHLRALACRTAVVQSFDRDLAIHLAGTDHDVTDIDTALWDLSAQGFPVIIAGYRDSRTYYTYPGLVRAYLQAELRRSGISPDDVLRSAALWSTHRRRSVDALSLALQMSDPEELSTVLVTSGIRMVIAGDIDGFEALLDRWCRVAPGSAESTIMRALVAAERGDLAASSMYLNEVDQAAVSGADLTCLLGALRLVADARHRPDGEDRPIGWVDPPVGCQDEVRAFALMAAGAVHISRGAVTWAEKSLRRADAIAAAASLDLLRVRIGAHRAAAADRRGDLAGMRSRAHTAIDIARACGREADEYVVRCAAMDAMAQYLVGERLTSELMTQPTAGTAAITGPRAPLLVLIADFAAAEDRYDTAVRACRALTVLIRTEAYPYPAVVLLPRVAYMCAAVGGTEWITRLVAATEKSFGQGPETVIATAVAMAANSRFDAARKTLTPILDAADAAHPATSMSAWALYAYTSAELDDEYATHRGLQRALAVGAPSGMIAPLLEGGEVIAGELARHVGTFGHLDALAAKVLRATRTHSLPEQFHLTPSERKVLDFLPSGYTADQIAGMLSVSVNTVKTHSRSIYRKLQVSTRRDAVMVARRAGLL